MFGKELTWPTKNSTIFHIHHVMLKDEGMMSMSNETCPRLSAAFRAIRNDTPTREMLMRNKQFLEPLISMWLREKSGLVNATEP